MMMSPALSGLPTSTIVRASHNAALSGLPRHAAPAPKDAAKPTDRWFASKLLRQAERLAKVPKQDGSLWHAYRRKWATERKHLPRQDVAQAGGWTDPATLQEIYQQFDEATTQPLAALALDRVPRPSQSRSAA